MLRSTYFNDLIKRKEVLVLDGNLLGLHFILRDNYTVFHTMHVNIILQSAFYTRKHNNYRLHFILHVNMIISLHFILLHDN